MNLWETGYVALDCIQMAQDRTQSRRFMNSVMNNRSNIAEGLLATGVIAKFQWKILIIGYLLHPEFHLKFRSRVLTVACGTLTKDTPKQTHISRLRWRCKIRDARPTQAPSVVLTHSAAELPYKQYTDSFLRLRQRTSNSKLTWEAYRERCLLCKGIIFANRQPFVTYTAWGEI
jgi:hypothetical protein